jgi:DNA-binding CsgD family transcriptional regulator
LTYRECEILARVACGLTSRQIGAYFHISFRTVDKYRTIIRYKTGMRRLDEWIFVAEREGWIAGSGKVRIAPTTPYRIVDVSGGPLDPLSERVCAKFRPLNIR